ncbi:peptidoglycan editing factor PgeF [Paenibacillus sp. LMG 31456]|uniref:Purine nucleoside phosphorylase n=1 Tax=Paenibacillus foliorum TaxID=2654974 RepID=A0A972GSJ2_9BACL|nr:peptidoglycan editing factor PgeF [Paenibacillus foliorum]NOU95390.1 peptidoglycan editing factor PgeF [Paenibacillus foliorum]
MEPFLLRKEQNGCGLLFIKNWLEKDSGLTAGFTSRLGGVSEPPFGSLNCGLHVQDSSSHVVNNRQLLAEALHAQLDDCTYAEQVHGNEVEVITKAHAGAGIHSREEAIQSKDAFVTNQTGIFLHALFADCVPLYFYDPIHRAIGLAHAGWKGTVLQIAKETIKAMQREYGSTPGKIVAAIGPSIQACCYEVDEVVLSKVREVMAELEIADDAGENSSIYEYSGNDKYKLSLQQLNRQIMIKAGIMPEHIEISSLCTSCRTDLFFSHRKESGKTGRMAAWIGLYE